MQTLWRGDLLIEKLRQIMLAGVVKYPNPFYPFYLSDNAFVRPMGGIPLFLRVPEVLSSVPTAELCVVLRQGPALFYNPFFEFGIDFFET